MNRNFLMLNLALAAAVGPATAAEPATNPAPDPNVAPAVASITRVNSPGYGVIPYKALFELHSVEGETMDEFALRISPRLREFSDATRFEACGAIGKSADGRFGVIIATNESHIGCVSSQDILPEGMTAANQTIHSHGKNESVVMNKTDQALFGKDLDQHGFGYKTGRGLQKKRISGQGIHEFSRADLTGDDGYLAVGEGKVLHHTAGQVRSITR